MSKRVHDQVLWKVNVVTALVWTAIRTNRHTVNVDAQTSRQLQYKKIQKHVSDLYGCFGKYSKINL